MIDVLLTSESNWVDILSKISSTNFSESVKDFDGFTALFADLSLTFCTLLDNFLVFSIHQ